VAESGMIRIQMGRTVDQKMAAFAWDALYGTTRNSNQYVRCLLLIVFFFRNTSRLRFDLSLM
jgi:hypothetical protein